MTAIFSLPDWALVHFCVFLRRSRAAFALAILLAACALASAQTASTTISGAVFDPRTTSSALPLPHVLVYATTEPVDPLPTGVQCLTYQAPTNVVSYTYTAVDGTFTLTDIPENASYTIVIQAGKWRRQFLNQTVGIAPLTGLELHMPADHTQGDIPLIAVATGNLDGSECVLRDMGIADTEYTDDNGTGGGRIHLYIGTDAPGYGYGGGGAAINASTPTDVALIQIPATLANYDVVLLPCHGFPSPRQPVEMTDIMNYTDVGGRIFTSDFGYEWLDPNTPYNSPFPPIANWDIYANAGLYPATVTVNTQFNDGATMAQWLDNAGATLAGTNDQIQIQPAYVRLDTVIAPTQSWLTLNSNSYSGQKGNPSMQFTFNTPVGAPAANQCGRAMFVDYHVIPTVAYGRFFPVECPPLPAVMKPQEEMLEYALFDLSAFVQPVVTPTISIAFAPSPLTVKSGDNADQLVVNVTNTSTSTAIDSFVSLSFVPPPLVTVTGITDSAGGWICSVATLSCTRTTELAASASDAVTLTLSVGTYATAPSAGQLTATVSDATFSTNPSASDTVIYQQQPVITWATPKAITFGTPLSGTQLDATANVAGSFSIFSGGGNRPGDGHPNSASHVHAYRRNRLYGRNSHGEIDGAAGNSAGHGERECQSRLPDQRGELYGELPSVAGDAHGHGCFHGWWDADWHGHNRRRIGHVHDNGANCRTSFHHRGVLRGQQLHGGNEPRDGGECSGLYSDSDWVKRGECARRRHSDLYVDDYASGRPNDARGD